MEEGGPTCPGWTNFSQGAGSNSILVFKPIELVIFQGAGARPLPPPPLDPRVASETGFVHTPSWPKDIA